MKNSFWKDKSVLVTGHTGFKGGWLIYVLSLLGAKAYGYSNEVKPSPSVYDLWATQYKKSNAEVIADINDIVTLQDAIITARPDVVIHMAAQPLVLESYNNPLKTIESNILGTANLLECCRGQEQLKSIVIVTTDKVYEVGKQSKSFTEEDKLGGKDIYSASKACCELITSSYKDSFFNNPSAANISTVRAGNVIGGGDWSENRLIPDIVRAYQNNEECMIRNPDATRPWQHVLEPLSGYLNVAQKMFECADYGSAWNFGPDKNNLSTVRNTVEITKLVLEDLTIKYDDTQIPANKETHNLSIDSDKAQKLLGWSARLSLEETIKQTLAWYKAETDEQRTSITQNQISNFWEI